MSRTTWIVWSWDARNQAWLQVDEGTKQYAEESARYRNTAAEKHGLDDACFMATPAGAHPGPLPSTAAAARRGLSQ